jgi:glucuronate isomerase
VYKRQSDNWLRCWFNGLDAKEIEKRMVLPSSLKEWERYMSSVFRELFRITKEGGWVAFEVGEVRNGKVRLEESIVPIGVDAGFDCAGVLINSHDFTKTSNIWGVSNNSKGTNTNRVALFRK